VVTVIMIMTMYTPTASTSSNMRRTKNHPVVVVVAVVVVSRGTGGGGVVIMFYCYMSSGACILGRVSHHAFLLLLLMVVGWMDGWMDDDGETERGVGICCPFSFSLFSFHGRTVSLHVSFFFSSRKTEIPRATVSRN
jgi:hypothetical protein